MTQLSDLAHLETTSITAITSVNFFLINSGVNGYISGNALQAHLGFPVDTLVTRSTDFSATAATNNIVSWQGEARDGLGLWDSGDATKFNLPCNGWWQCYGSFKSTTNNQNEIQVRFFKNGASFLGGGAKRFLSQTTDAWPIIGGPFAANSGDAITMIINPDVTQNIDSANNQVFFGIIPLALWLP